VNDDYHDPELGPILDLARPARADAALDCGCGAGQLAFSLAPVAGSVEAVDPDAEILKEAERLAAELQVGGVVFRHADLHALPYPAGRFNLVVAYRVLHLQADPGAILREMTRVLAVGGRIVVDEPIVDESTDRHFNELSRLREPEHWRYYRAEECEALFRECGLRVTESRQVRRSVDQDYWIGAAQTPPRNADIIRERIRSLPVPVQAAMDVVFADRRVSFSYSVLVARLER
jgi:SAM-dependent methyltransferase